MTGFFSSLSAFLRPSSNIFSSLMLLFCGSLSIADESLTVEDELRQAFSNYLTVFENRELERLDEVMSQRYLNFVTNQLTSMRRTQTRETMGELIAASPGLFEAGIEEIVVNGPTAGMVLGHEIQSASGESQVVYWFVKFVEEGSVWKVDYPRQIYGSEMTYTINGYEVSFQRRDSASAFSSFLIDGNVPIAPDLLPLPDIVAYMQIECFGCELQVTVNGVLQGASRPGMGLVLGGLNYGENRLNLKILEAGSTSGHRQISFFQRPESQSVSLLEPEKVIFQHDIADSNDTELDVTFNVESQ